MQESWVFPEDLLGVMITPEAWYKLKTLFALAVLLFPVFVQCDLLSHNSVLKLLSLIIKTFFSVAFLPSI